MARLNSVPVIRTVTFGNLIPEKAPGDDVSERAKVSVSRRRSMSINACQPKFSRAVIMGCVLLGAHRPAGRVISCRFTVFAIAVLLPMFSHQAVRSAIGNRPYRASSDSSGYPRSGSFFCSLRKMRTCCWRSLSARPIGCLNHREQRARGCSLTDQTRRATSLR